MKTLKVKSVLLTLTIILFFSVLFTSCAKNDVADVVTVLMSDKMSHVTASLTAPADVYDKGDEYLSDYLAAASEELTIKLSNNYIAALALQEAGKIDEVIKNELYGFHFSDVDLSKYLPDTEVSKIQADFITDISYLQSAKEAGTGCWRICPWTDSKWESWYLC